LSEGDVWLPKLFRQTVSQRWPSGGKTAVTELVAWSLNHQYRLPEQDDFAVIVAALTRSRWTLTAAVSKEMLSAAFCN